MNFINRIASKCRSSTFEKVTIILHLQHKPASQPHLLFSRRNTTTVRDIMKKNKSSRDTKINTKKYFMLIIPVSSFLLGVWQVRRRAWKLELIDDLNHRINIPTKPLPINLLELKDMEYTKVSVRGRFDHSRETLILPRINILSIDKNLPAQTGGAHVVTPFKISQDGREILVNRGWVAKKKIDPESRMHAQITDEIDLVGVVRHDEIRPAYSAPTSNKLWHIRDITGLSQQLQTLPVFIDADINSSIEGGPIGGQTKVHLRNEHMQYILTWFSLSAATTFMWLKMFVLK